ncbi:hypothetical protein UFOVP328_51 [uncultured Caudovirales phage]|uniref:Uncharacterized protein n=1 Tax=uncultured Caudovirales phage TaxID=2100421 RepID=A0A6J5LX46_9CAUD|nr:hypothetical protein UFOVP328_51 [uncultured Caudovirales phage]
MTKKQYRSAMGKVVDMGALQLQNETVRAVGNMNVNARGDTLNSTNQVIDKKSQQVRRQYQRQSNVNTREVATSNVAVKKAKQPVSEVFEDSFTDLPEDNDVVANDIVAEETTAEETTTESTEFRGGLAAAIARSRTVKQQLEKTPRQLAKEASIKKI